MDDSTLDVIRSEERLRVGRTRVPYEVVRIRKRIVTEERTITVPVRREELVVERVPVGHDASLAGDTGEVIEIVLSEEDVEVVTRVVPRERVRITKVAVAEEVPVSAELRAEQIEVERVPDGRPGYT